MMAFGPLACGGGTSARPGLDAAAVNDGDSSSNAAPGGAGGIAGQSGGGGATGSGGATIPPQTCLPPISQDAPADRLSQTGCVDPVRPSVLAASVVPYEVNSPLWSDGADKTRGMALPTGGKIRVKDCAAEPASCPQGPADTGKWIFPVGTVMVKNFLFDGKFVETRLFVRFDEATWVGYSYRWDEAQTDATIVPDDRVRVSFNTGMRQIEWNYPNRIDCTKCHTPGAGWTLGPETRQMNRMVANANQATANQIDRLHGLGLFAVPPAKPYQTALVTPYPSKEGGPPPNATIDEKARSYLHANCANCHRPDGEYPDLDLRYDVALKGTHVCGAPAARGDLVPGNLVFDPGKPENSVTWLRMNVLPDPAGGKTARMPQVATFVVDSEGLKVVGDWIKSVASCPP